MIACRTFYGEQKLVPKDKLILRPSAYALTLNQGQILLVRMRRAPGYALPGGGVDIGERIEDGLKREVREETGLEIRVQKFAAFKEEFFYYDPLDVAFHSLLFFYVCKPLTFDLVADDQVEDGEVVTPRWIDANSLEEGDFHSHGDLIMGVLRSYDPV